MSSPFVDEDLILLDVQAATPEDAIRVLGAKLLDKGCVCDGFINAVLEREKDFPTGLPTVIPVALPHTDAKFCAQSALAIAVLRQPVTFHEMGDASRELPVQIVLLLAIDDPKTQILWLQRIATLIQDEACLNGIRSATDRHDVATRIQGLLKQKEESC